MPTAPAGDAEGGAPLTDAPASRADVARRNRELYPDAAAIIDKVRSVFPDAKVTYFGPTRSGSRHEDPANPVHLTSSGQD